jgi:endonuclease/exonuclease/phosphatase family metal-dependent hydrolase
MAGDPIAHIVGCACSGAGGAPTKEETTLSHAHVTARRAGLLALAAALVLSLLASTGVEAKKRGHKSKAEVVNVMTRNLYLGADLAPPIAAKSVGEFTEANGKVLRDVTANDFPTRAKGLAEEIKKKSPDLVGLQEVALWRTGPPTLEPVLGGRPPDATTVRYDYLQLLLDQLNKGKKRYRVAVSQDEFDFEAPADENGVAGDGPNGVIPNAEINGRLTMRDVILARVGAVKVTHPQSAHFSHLLVETVSGQKVIVTRGWTAIDAQVNGGRKFHFVDTHLESFDPATEVPSIRAQQASELLAGPLVSKLPTILVGDLNSDDNTVEPGDQQAYRTLLDGGMRERSTGKPLGCCLNTSLLAENAGGNVADFNHQVDHIMTADPKLVKLIGSSVTGRKPVNGFWDSDHGGLFSSLLLK